MYQVIDENIFRNGRTIEFMKRIIAYLVGIAGLINLACGDNGSEPNEFPKTIALDYHAVWSGQHDLIAYIHDRIPFSDDPDSSGIYIIKPDGTEKRLFYRSRLTFGIDWTRDGRWIIANSGGRLVKISYPEGQPDTLTPSGKYFDPVWSPDANKIAYSVHAGDSTGIYLLDFVGEKRLVIPHGKAVDWTFTDSLVYTNLDWALPLGAICMADTAGSFKRVIYTLPENIVYVTPVPRRNLLTGRIVFHAQEPGEAESIWTLEPGSEQAAQLKEFGLRPNFSPDGQRIVFTDIHKDNGRLWIINWDGTGLRPLTF